MNTRNISRFIMGIVGLFIVGSIVFTALGGAGILDFAGFSSMFGEIKGSLTGREFNIVSYDNFGNPVMTAKGSKVHVGLLENDANFNNEGAFESTVLEITVDSKSIYTVGNTTIFAESGLNMVSDFSEFDDLNLEGNGEGGFMPFDRLVNNIKNFTGREKIIVISSQLGIPIGVYEGDDVYVEVPENLPKMTLLNIDGKALYISRANYIIFDKELID